MLTRFFTLALSLPILLLSACKEKKAPQTERKLTAVPTAASQPIKQENTLPKDGETLLMRRAAASSIPWHEFNSALFDRAKAENRLVCAYVSDVESRSMLEVMETMENSPRLLKKLGRLGFLALVDGNLAPELQARTLELLGTVNSPQTLPAFIWFSSNGDPITWNSIQPPTNGKVQDIDLGTDMVSDIWEADPDYVKQNSMNAGKTRAEARITDLTSHSPLVSSTKDLSDFVRELSAIYDPGTRRLDYLKRDLPLDAIEVLLLGGDMKNIPAYLSERSRNHALNILDEMLKSGIRDDIDGLFFTKMSRSGHVAPDMQKRAIENLKFISLLFRGADQTLPETSSWTPTAERALLAVESLMTTADGNLAVGYLSAVKQQDFESAHLWTYAELESALSADELKSLSAASGIRELSGNVTSFNTRITNEKNLNFLNTKTAPIDSPIIEKLAAARKAKQPETQLPIFAPLRENAIFSSVAFEAYKATGKEEWLEKALKRLKAIQSDLVSDAGVSQGWVSGRASRAKARAQSLAYLLKALLDAYTCTADETWLSDALKLTAFIQSEYTSTDFPLLAETGRNTARSISPVVINLHTSGKPTFALLQRQLDRLDELGIETDLEQLKEKLAAIKPAEEKDKFLMVRYRKCYSLIMETRCSPATVLVTSEDKSVNTKRLREEVSTTGPLTDVILLSPERASQLTGKAETQGSVIRMTESGEPIMSTSAVNP